MELEDAQERALLGLGQITLDKRLLAMGVEVFDKAVKLAPDSADAWIGLGKAYYNQSLDLSRAQSASRLSRSTAFQSSCSARVRSASRKLSTMPRVSNWIGVGWIGDLQHQLLAAAAERELGSNSRTAPV